MSLLHDAVGSLGWFVVCDCGISRSYSLTFQQAGPYAAPINRVDLLLCCGCLCSVSHLHDAVGPLGWFVVCDCGISRSYSLTFQQAGPYAVPINRERLKITVHVLTI